MCGTDGRCMDPRCTGVACAEGQKCVEGGCVDACAGVMCPNGGQCVNGNCQAGNGNGSGGSSSGGGTDGGIDLGGGLNLSGSNGTGANGSGNSTGGPKPITKDPGCACDVVGRSPAGSAALLLGGLGVVLLGARRRRLAA
jgi:hypothetical protein